ncbi:MAG: hypothetical protein K6C34_03390, partial [Alphaproteobacteria bacterium]|nr:hypothetical protein [Alphaproteobacteria bacterium]
MNKYYKKFHLTRKRKYFKVKVGWRLGRWTFQLIFSVFILFNVENAFSEEEIFMETITVKGKNTHQQNDGVENLEDEGSCTKKTSSSSLRINGARASDTLIFVDGIRLDDAPSADGSFNVDLLNNKKLKHEKCLNDTTFEIDDNLPEKNEMIISHSLAS